MHRINVKKSDEEQVRQLLDEANITYDFYGVPSNYSVLSFNARISTELVDQITPLAVKSGTHWDWRQVDDGEVEALVESLREAGLPVITLDELKKFGEAEEEGER